MSVCSKKSTGINGKSGEHFAINDRISERDFRYYIFDWDDNILHMPTRIHLLKRTPEGSWVPHRVSTSVYSVIRDDTDNYRPPGDDWESAFVEFRDLNPKGESKFLSDTRKALERAVAGGDNAAPSFNTFKQTLIEGRLFAIVTARGHKTNSLRDGVAMFIDMVLTDDERHEMLRNLRGYMAFFDNLREDLSNEDVIDYYLNLNHYHAVTSPKFKENLREAIPGAESPEEGKQFAIRDFVNHIIRIVSKAKVRRPISVGFSDDDPGNVAAVEEFIRKELSTAFPGVRFVVYDTSDPDLPNGRKVVVSGQMDLGLL